MVHRPEQSAFRRTLQCPLQIARSSLLDRSALAQLLEPPYTDPYVRWCGRGGAQRLPPIPIARNTQPKKIVSVLNEVIDAAESVETTHLRKDALAAIEELKRKGPGFKHDWSTWGTIGQGALALGCIAAATTGHVEFGLPCVIGGAASGAAMSVISSQ